MTVIQKIQLHIRVIQNQPVQKGTQVQGQTGACDSNAEFVIGVVLCPVHVLPDGAVLGEYFQRIGKQMPAAVGQNHVGRRPQKQLGTQMLFKPDQTGAESCHGNAQRGGGFLQSAQLRHSHKFSQTFQIHSMTPFKKSE